MGEMTAGYVEKGKGQMRGGIWPKHNVLCPYTVLGESRGRTCVPALTSQMAGRFSTLRIGYLPKKPEMSK